MRERQGERSIWCAFFGMEDVFSFCVASAAAIPETVVWICVCGSIACKKRNKLKYSVCSFCHDRTLTKHFCRKSLVGFGHSLEPALTMDECPDSDNISPVIAIPGSRDPETPLLSSQRNRIHTSQDPFPLPQLMLWKLHG